MTERDIFVAALREPSGARADFLRRACGQNADMEARIASLLDEYARLGSFLEAPAVGAETTPARRPESDLAPTASHAAHTAPGEFLAGRYKLLEEVGEGGMGSVWLAEQMEPVRRRVAVKLIKAGMDSRQVVARFEAERQALALMDHPNIAKVLDGGVASDGRPFFVMELVKGIPITRYCDEKRLPVSERLALFASVCEAVQHAHQKGVIHRDIKPSNVLIAPYDGRPVVKVIDFGVAKAAGQPLTEKTLFTGLGAVVGTPEYMSPEQAELNNHDVDTRSDVYSLGVLLYELLTGTTPLTRQRVKEAALFEVLRIVREEEPPRPSTRLSTTEELPSLAANRAVDPAKLPSLVRGELDWIVMRALEKDRARRYETATALAADVARYLAGEQVQAVPPSASYRLRKFARRNRLTLGAATAVGLALLAAVVGLAVSNSLIKDEARAKEQAQERQAQEQADKEAALTALLGARTDKEHALTGMLREQNLKLEEAQGRARANAAWRRSAYYLKTALILNEWRASNRAQATEMLDECPADLRGWEWDYLNRLCNGQSRNVPIGEPRDRWALTFSPDLARVASVDQAGNLHMHDAQSGRELFNFAEHLGRTSSIAFSPDGRRIATCGSARFKDRSERGVLQIWDLTGRRLGFFTGPRFTEGGGTFFRASFSTDATRIAAIDLRGNLMVCDVLRKRVLWRASAHPIFPTPGWNLVWFTSVSMSPDGKRVATVSELEAEGVVWDVETGKPVMSLKGGGEGFNRVQYSPKGTWIVTVGRWRDDEIKVPDSTIRLWDAKTGQQVRVFQSSIRPVTNAVVSPDETKLAAGNLDGAVTIWDLTTGQMIGTYTTRDRDLYALAFGPDSRTLATTCRGVTPGDTFGRMIQYWDASRGPESRSFPCQGAWKTDISPDGRFVLAAANHPTEKRQMVVVWDADTGKSVRTFGEPKDAFLAVAYSPDGKTVAVSALPAIGVCEVRLYDPRTGELLRTLATPDGKQGAPCDALAFNHDGTRLATGAQDRVVRLWDVATGRQLWEQKAHDRSVSGLGFSRDGKRLVSATGGLDRVSPAHFGNSKAPNWPTDSTDFEKDPAEVKVWDVASAGVLMTLPLTRKTQAVAISPDGETVAVGFGESRVLITIQLGFGGSRGGERMEYRENFGGDKSIRLYKVPTGKLVGTLKGHARPTRALAFSPDGRRIATAGGSDDAVKLWDAATGDEILTLGPHPGMVTDVRFSGNGHRIVSGSMEQARLWDATPLPK